MSRLGKMNVWLWWTTLPAQVALDETLLILRRWRDGQRTGVLKRLIIRGTPNTTVGC